MPYGIMIKVSSADKWECVMVFDCSRKAAEYREKYYSQFKNWCIKQVLHKPKKVERYENQ